MSNIKLITIPPVHNSNQLYVWYPNPPSNSITCHNNRKKSTALAAIKVSDARRQGVTTEAYNSYSARRIERRQRGRWRLDGGSGWYQRLQKYLMVGLLLHLVTVFGMGLFLCFTKLVFTAYAQGQILGIWYFFLAGYGFCLIIFAQMDAKSRFQNYKRIKDLLYEQGFKARIIKPFLGSRCQRDAVKVAAKDIGFSKKLDRHYRRLGYCWYHVLPDFVFFKPWIIFTRKYWLRTLFEKKYESKYFLW
ncbi:MAG: hypothetical protein GY729_02580 [Desulfobacteraceae bacterium]|nr:hypothetical protein [Desulfobacteraceae bacterium]